MILNVTTGEFLKQLRKKNGLTQKKTAEMFRTNRSTYSSWENKYRNKKLPKSVTQNNAFTILRFNLTYKEYYMFCEKHREEIRKQSKIEKKGFIKCLKAMLKNLFK